MASFVSAAIAISKAVTYSINVFIITVLLLISEINFSFRCSTQVEDKLERSLLFLNAILVIFLRDVNIKSIVSNLYFKGIILVFHQN